MRLIARCWLATTLTILSTIFPVLVAARETPLPTVGQWRTSAWHDDRTGRFSYCAGGVSYRSEILLLVVVGREYHWGLVFVDEQRRWGLRDGERIPIEIRFDGRAPWTGTATARGSASVVVHMAPNSTLVQEFRRSIGMQVFARGQRFGFRLDGTSALLPVLVDCVRTQLAIERGEPPPRVAAAPPRPRQLQPGSPPAPRTQATPSGPTEAQLLATHIATNFLLEMRVENARLVPAEDTPAAIRERGVMWRSDSGVGSVMVIPAGISEGTQEVVAALIAEDSRSCRGEFASGRSSALIDETVVTRGFTACQDSAGATRTGYTVFSRPGGGQVVFGFVPRPEASTPESAMPEPDRDRAALRATVAR